MAGMKIATHPPGLEFPSHGWLAFYTSVKTEKSEYKGGLPGASARDRAARKVVKPEGRPHDERQAVATQASNHYPQYMRLVYHEGQKANSPSIECKGK